MNYEYDSWIVLVAQLVSLLIWIWFVLPSLSVYVQVNTLVLNTTDYHSVLDRLNIRPFLWWTMLIYTWDWDATVCCFSIPRLPESNLPLMWFSLLPSSRKTWKKLFIVFAHTHIVGINFAALSPLSYRWWYLSIVTIGLLFGGLTALIMVLSNWLPITQTWGKCSVVSYSIYHHNLCSHAGHLKKIKPASNRTSWGLIPSVLAV